MTERLSPASIEESLGGAELHCFPVAFSPLLVSSKMRTWLRHAVPGFDIVSVHGLYRFPPTYAAYCARRSGIPYIIRPHGALDPFLFGRSSRSLLLKRLYERYFDIPNLRLATAIHYTTEEERVRASFLGLSTPTFVVPNGIDQNRFTHLPPRGALRRKLGLHDAPLLLFLGRINFKKGLDLLIEAFADVARSVPQTHLLIAGPDNEGYGRNVRGWIRDHHLEAKTHFLDFLSPEEVVQAYVDADVFVLPSYTENFGLTVVEAMACGTPVVISDQVNIHREVAASRAGIVTPCDAAPLAAAIANLLADPSQARAMGQNGRTAALTEYSWPTIERALLREYEAAIARHRSRVSTAPESVADQQHASRD